jgi:hypothetical protein
LADDQFVGAGVGPICLFGPWLSCAYSMVTPVKGSTRRLAICEYSVGTSEIGVDVLGMGGYNHGEMLLPCGGTVAVSLS